MTPTETIENELIKKKKKKLELIDLEYMNELLGTSKKSIQESIDDTVKEFQK